MNRNKVVEKFITARNSGFTVVSMQDLVDAIIDCAVKESSELVWKQLNDLAEKCEAIRKGEVQE